MLIDDEHGFVRQALSRCECLLSNRETWPEYADAPDVVVGNNRELLRLVRIALDVASGKRASVDELCQQLGAADWCVVKARRADRPHYNRAGREQRQILSRELVAADRAALEARHA